VTLRADAQRNLDRVLDAAAACFAEKGCDASVDEIARRAGVGHGTVFRRFPSKDALIQAVLGERLASVTTVAEECIGEPGGFERFLRHAAAEYAHNRALVEALKRCAATVHVEALTSAVERLVQRAQAAGELREDVTADDVLRLVPTASAYPDVVLDGLRAIRQGSRHGS
jgi:AcrR family transcriptional regulator